jgi:hypothetical protein
MQTPPKHKIALISGVILFCTSPFLFFYVPPRIVPYFCTPPPDPYGRDWFPCSEELFYTGIFIPCSALALGTLLIIFVLRSGNKSK